MTGVMLKVGIEMKHFDFHFISETSINDMKYSRLRYCSVLPRSCSCSWFSHCEV